MATDAQIRANQRNCLRSTGPKTLEGKASSSRNALKHGLTASGDTLPDEDSTEVEEQTAAYRASVHPTDEREDALVRQMAADAVRLDRSWQLTRLMIRRYAERARTCWDLDRQADAEELAARLPREPARIRAALRKTRYGCEVMIERWDALARLAATPGGWDASRRSLALDLLGVHPDLRDGATPIDPPDGTDPSEYQQSLAAAEAARLRVLQTNRLDAWDADEREIAESSLGAEFSRPLTILRRYESALQRRWFAAHRYFLDRNRNGAPPPPAPTPTPAPDPEPTPTTSSVASPAPRPVAKAVEPSPSPSPAPARPMTRRLRKYLARQEREAARSQRTR